MPDALSRHFWRMVQHPNIVIVAQAGRLTFEALLFAATLRSAAPDYTGRLFVAEPQPGPLWPDDPRINDPDARAALDELGAEIVPFDSVHFGAAYPIGNKVEALTALPDAPFVFFDSDTVVTGPLDRVPFDPARPTASMARTATWPVIELYGPSYAQTWRALYDRLDLDFAASLDPSQPDDHWERFLYFNAGWFTAAHPQQFHDRMVAVMTMVRDDPPPELVCQPIYPWLDQIALPLVIHGLGGGRPGPQMSGLDGDTTLHYRTAALIHARSSDAGIAAITRAVSPNRVKKVLKRHPPFHRLFYRGDGDRIRALLAPPAPPLPAHKLPGRLKRAGLWVP